MTKCLVKHRVKSFVISAPYTINVVFEDETKQIINFKKILGGGMYRPLLDSEFFNKVFISDEIATLTWPNGADFNPDHLYNWPDHENLYSKRVREWEDVHTEQHT